MNGLTRRERRKPFREKPPAPRRGPAPAALTKELVELFGGGAAKCQKQEVRRRAKSFRGIYGRGRGRALSLAVEAITTSRRDRTSDIHKICLSAKLIARACACVVAHVAVNE